MQCMLVLPPPFSPLKLHGAGKKFQFSIQILWIFRWWLRMVSIGFFCFSSLKENRFAWAKWPTRISVYQISLGTFIYVRIFLAIVESVLLFGSETWTFTKSMEKQLNGVYTRLLRMALGVTWRQHLTNEEVYQDLPLVSS